MEEIVDMDPRVEALAEWLHNHYVKPPLPWDRVGAGAKSQYYSMAVEALTVIDRAAASADRPDFDATNWMNIAADANRE